MMKKLFVSLLMLICVFTVSCTSVDSPDLIRSASYAEDTFRLSFMLPVGWKETALSAGVSYNDKKWVYDGNGNNVTLVIACEDLWISEYRDDLWAALSDGERARLTDERQTYDFKTAGIQTMYVNRFEKDYASYSPAITTEEINGIVHIKIEFSVSTTAGKSWVVIYCVMQNGVYYGFTFTTPYATQTNWDLIESILKTVTYQLL